MKKEDEASNASDIVIYEDDQGEVAVMLHGDTLWLSLQQLAGLFGRDKSVVSRHLKNIFDSGELARPAKPTRSITTI